MQVLLRRLDVMNTLSIKAKTKWNEENKIVNRDIPTFKMCFGLKHLFINTAAILHLSR